MLRIKRRNRVMFVSRVPVSPCYRVSESPRSRAPRPRGLRPVFHVLPVQFTLALHYMSQTSSQYGFWITQYCPPPSLPAVMVN